MIKMQIQGLKKIVLLIFGGIKRNEDSISQKKLENNRLCTKGYGRGYN